MVDEIPYFEDYTRHEHNQYCPQYMWDYIREIIDDNIYPEYIKVNLNPPHTGGILNYSRLRFLDLLCGTVFGFILGKLHCIHDSVFSASNCIEGCDSFYLVNRFQCVSYPLINHWSNILWRKPYYSATDYKENTEVYNHINNLTQDNKLYGLDITITCGVVMLICSIVQSHEFQRYLTFNTQYQSLALPLQYEIQE